MYMPIGIFGVSVATAAIPDLARHAADERARRHADDALVGSSADADVERAGDGRPDGAGAVRSSSCIYAARPVRRHLDTAHGAHALLFYAPGIVGYSIVKIAAPSFYSLQDARTPVLASVVTMPRTSG